GDQTKLRLRLLGNDGFLWGEADEAIGGGFRLPAAPTWTERRALPVVPGTPAGNYRVEAQLDRESASGTHPIDTLGLSPLAVASPGHRDSHSAGAAQRHGLARGHLYVRIGAAGPVGQARGLAERHRMAVARRAPRRSGPTGAGGRPARDGSWGGLWGRDQAAR